MLRIRVTCIIQTNIRGFRSPGLPANMVFTEDQIHNEYNLRNGTHPTWMFFNCQVGHDITFYVGSEGHVVFEHKLLLETASQELRTLTQEGENVILQNVNQMAFLSLLRFVYRQETVVDPNSVAETLGMAFQYQVTPFLESLESLITPDQVTQDNVLKFWQVIAFRMNHRLYNPCLSIIREHAVDVLGGEAALRLRRQDWTSILQLERLQIREIDLYSAYLNWSEEQCRRNEMPIEDKNRRKFMVDLGLIRFPTMTLEEFASGPLVTQVLTTEEKSIDSISSTEGCCSHPNFSKTVSSLCYLLSIRDWFYRCLNTELKSQLIPTSKPSWLSPEARREEQESLSMMK